MVKFVKSLFKKNPPPPYYEGVITHHKNLVNQRLAPRTGHDGFLINQICKGEINERGECNGVTSFERYDLRNPETREGLNKLRFACNVGGRRYRISMDQPGLIRQELGCLEYKKKPISRKKYCSKEGIVKTDFIDATTKYQHLINGATECLAGY